MGCRGVRGGRGKRIGKQCISKKKGGERKDEGGLQ